MIKNKKVIIGTIICCVVILLIIFHIEKTAFERGSVYGASYMAGAYDKTNGYDPSPKNNVNFVGYMAGYNDSRKMSHSNHYYIGDKVTNTKEYFNLFKNNFSGTVRDIQGGNIIVISFEESIAAEIEMPLAENGTWTSGGKGIYRDSLTNEGECYISFESRELFCPINEYWTEPLRQ